MAEKYDFIIIGSGAGGGTMLARLARTGKRILVLERGDYLPRERENWDETEVFTNGRYLPNEKWLDSDGTEFQPFIHYWVGGNTKMYGAALLRLRESDFGKVRHYGGISPGWPISYDALEPFYQEAEELYSVHGSAGSDPTEPWRSRPYPYGPVPFEPRMAEIFEGFRKQGLQPFPCALGVRLPGDGGARRAPLVLSNFDGYPDLTETKADSEVVCVEPAVAMPNVDLIVNAYVERIDCDASGRTATEAVVMRHGVRETYSADVFVVACGAINSAALMLRSASDQHPRGLANSSGLVGRNYMTHNNGMVVAITEIENPSQFQKAFAITDFYHGAADSELPLGCIQLMGKPDADFLESIASEFLPGIPKAELWRHTVDFFITAEDLPLRDNRVTLANDGQIQLHYSENNREAYSRLRQKLVEQFENIGCRTAHCHRENVYVGPKLGISGVSHQSGTLVFGSDARESVLDENCKAHDLSNLYVADASFFPSCGAVNPSLTIMANALRVGDHLASLSGGEG